MIWDDGDDLHAEPRAPYPHTRETLLLRAEREGSAALCSAASPARSRPTTCSRTGLGPRAGRARASGCATGSRCGWPGRATPSWRATRSPAARGCPRWCTRWSARGSRPVRCSSRRRGWATPPRWPASAAAPPPAVQHWRSLPGPAGHPAGRRRRRAAGGAAPTTRPGRAPSAVTAGCGRPSSATPAPPRSSAGPSRPRRCGRRPRATPCWPRSAPQPAIVVATPGAEPVAEGGYAAVVLLDTWLMLARPDLRTGEEAVRRWANADRPGPARRPRRRGGRPGLPRPAGAGAVGPRRVRGPRGGRASLGPPAAGVPAGHHHRRAGRRRRRADPARAARGGRDARPGAGRRRRGAGRACGCRGRRGRRSPGPCCELQRVRSARKLDAVRVQVDPLTL